MSGNPAVDVADTLFPAMCRAVVVNPDKVQVTVKHGRASSSVSVSPHPDEAGNVIGKRGRTVKALNTIARAAGDRHQWPITFGVETPPGDNPQNKDRGVIPWKKWDAEAMESLLLSTLSSFLYWKPELTVLVETPRRTSWEVVLDDSEPVAKVDDDAVAAALDAIFGAIGKLHGKTISIAYVRRGTATKQPATAAGRFAKEKAA